MGRYRRNAPCLAVAASLLAAAAIAFAAAAQISRPVDVVVLDVSVTDNRTPISGLTKENFRVYEDGKPQQLSFFHGGDAPATVGLVIDSSQSMRLKRSEVVAASLGFVAGSNPEDEMFVTHFNDVVATGFPSGERFSSDQEKLRDALLAVKPAGRTSLYDALMVAMRYLEDGRHSRRALLVVSDGGDNQSRAKLDDVVEAAQRSNVTIYTVGIYDRNAKDRNPGVLRKLAKVTGGEFYEPRRLGQIHDICRHIAQDIRNRYTLGYVPQFSPDDQRFRKIEVRVESPGHEDLEAHTRPGYYPPQPQTAKAK